MQLFGDRVADPDDGAVQAFVLNNDPTTHNSPWRLVVTPPDLVTPGQYHHVAMRWDGSAVAVFVDGVPQGSTPYNPVPGSGLSYHNGSVLVLGAATAWGTPGTHEFIGQLDDVRFYGRARTDVEIFTDYVSRGHKPAEPLAR